MERGRGPVAALACCADGRGARSPGNAEMVELRSRPRLGKEAFYCGRNM